MRTFCERAPAGVHALQTNDSGVAMKISEHDVVAHDFDQLAREHHALMRDYGRVQTRCSEQLQAQAREIARLEAEVMRLRAEVIQRETALAWAREDRAALDRAIPDLPKRITLARRADALLARIQDLMRERPRAKRRTGDDDRVLAAAAVPQSGEPRTGEPDALEDSLHAADLVICQTGCLSHGAFWRVQEHCRRTGKTCVLVGQSDALRIVRIHSAPGGDSQASLATLQAEMSP